METSAMHVFSLGYDSSEMDGIGVTGNWTAYIPE